MRARGGEGEGKRIELVNDKTATCDDVHNNHAVLMTDDTGGTTHVIAMIPFELVQ
jgi:hypothetical protein